jgi:hypothetical protein
MIASLFFIQLGIEIFYKVVMISLILLERKTINLAFLDLSFFLRLTSFSLQFYCLLNLSLMDEGDSPDSVFWTPIPHPDDDFIFYNPYYKSFHNTEKIPEQTVFYIAQPNGGHCQEYKGKVCI